MLVAVLQEMHASFYFYFWNFHDRIFLPLFMLCYLRNMQMYIFVFDIYECGICGNLKFENNMRDMGKGTYLVAGDSGNGELYGGSG